ncbi:hypothetical protein ACLESO_48730 [Pyxidicoccus sp. 3LG]
MKRADTKRLALLAGVMVLALSGCELREEPALKQEPSASARVVVALPRSLPVDAVARVAVSATVTATGSSGDGSVASQELSGAGTEWQGVLRRIRSGPGTSVEVTAVDGQGATVARVRVADLQLARHRPALLVRGAAADADG